MNTPRPGRVIAVINSKGGVGKSSITANVAGQVALAGGRVLAVDLDLSGNLALDLGYLDQSDDGLGTFKAVHERSPLRPIFDVRPRLDVLPGGRYLEHLAALAGTGLFSDRPGGMAEAFAEALHTLTDMYELVLVDSAPGNPTLQEMSLHAARYVIVPIRSDSAGRDGLLALGPRVTRIRSTANPDLTWLGAVLFGHDRRATRIERRARDLLWDGVGEDLPLFDTVIRSSQAAAADCRERGQLAHELAVDAREATGRRLQYLQALSARQRGGNVVAMRGTDDVPEALASASAGLAEDYAALTEEILRRIRDVERSEAREVAQ